MFHFSPGTGTSLIILNVSALLGTVSSHFLVARGTDSFCLPQRVARSYLTPLLGKGPSEEPLGRRREAERPAAAKDGSVWGRNELTATLLSSGSYHQDVCSMGPCWMFLVKWLQCLQTLLLWKYCAEYSSNFYSRLPNECIYWAPTLGWRLLCSRLPMISPGDCNETSGVGTGTWRDGVRRRGRWWELWFL